MLYVNAFCVSLTITESEFLVKVITLVILKQNWNL